ncbi:MAG: MurR/RpiR family transcriptional regulator [Clostridia bacterium]|nr:MurR/RpiR family transcriptional regulator [Clostridia bacterium]
MSSTSNDLLNRIETNYLGLSKGQKRIADYILANYDKVAFMTASALGDVVGVSESTVVRFANALDYEGYPQLQKALQESIKTKLTTVQRFELSEDYDIGENYLKQIMASDMENIRKTMDAIDEEMIQKSVDALLKARKVYVLGLRSSSVLANYLGFYLNFILDSVAIVPSGANDLFDQLLNITEDDVLITFSFPRYSKTTYEVVEFAKSQGAKLIGITDSTSSPLVPLSDYYMTAKYNMNTFIDSLVAPMSLVNTLIIAVSICEKDKVKKSFGKLEGIWENYKIYNPK